MRRTFAGVGLALFFALPLHEAAATVTPVASPEMRSLWSQVRSGGHQTALEPLWRLIGREGAPIVEPVSDDPDSFWVTFLWRGEAERVVVAEYGLASFHPRSNLMTRIPGTQTWYLTQRLHRATKVIYTFSLDDPLIELTRYSSPLGVPWPRFVHRWMHDPHNPDTYLIPGSLILGGQDTTMSRLQLADARRGPWEGREARLPGKLAPRTVASKVLEEGGRDVFVYTPHADLRSDAPCHLLIVFDGDAYTSLVPTPRILDHLIANGAIPPTVAVFVRNPTPNPETRMRDLQCREPFFRFVGDELIPWIRENYLVTHDPAQTMVAGSSMGGLAAAYAGYLFSDRIGNVIAQSPAVQYQVFGEDAWLIARFVAAPTLPLRFYVEAGAMEIASGPNHAPSFRNTGRHFRDVLRAKGYPVTYREYPGSHDYICWQDGMFDGLSSLFAGSLTS